MTLEEFAGRCEGVKFKNFPKSGPGFVARCPNCISTSKHLSVCDKSDGFLHLFCQAGCSENDILSAMGLEQDGRRIEEKVMAARPAKPIGDKYFFVDIDGKPLFFKERYYVWHTAEPLKGKPDRWDKEFVQKMPDGTKGVASLNGQSKILYRFNEVAAAVKSGQTIYVNEGEKACEAFRSKGLVGTCQPGGAMKGVPETKWLAQHTEWLRGAAHIVIVADRDEVGEEYSRYVASQLTGVTKKLEVVQSATTREKDDAHDHFMAGHGPTDFVQRKDLLPARGFIRRVISPNFQPVVVVHLVAPWILRSKCHLLDADGGVGKSTLCLAWAAALSRGLHPITFVPLAGGPVKTLYLHKGEDSDEELETIYRANRGVPGMIEYAGEGLNFDSKGLRELEETIIDGDFGFVVVDALFYFLEGAVKGEGYAALDCVGVLTGLNKVAANTRAGFMCQRHTTKGVIGKAASELGMGSVQFRNSFRGQLVARYHPDKRGVVVVTDEKGSILNPKAEHFCYRRMGNEVEYLQREANPFDTVGGLPLTKVVSAERMLSDLLSGQWMTVQAIFECCKEAGIGRRTVEEAKAKLPIKYRRGGPDGPVFATIEIEKDEFEDPN